MKLLHCFRSVKTDPLIVTLLPGAAFVSTQEAEDAAILFEFNRRVAENIRTKKLQRSRKIAALRMRYAEAQRLHYFMQAG